jgi:hypothetical protein
MRDDDQMLAAGAKDLPAGMALITAEPLRTLRTSELEMVHGFATYLDSIPLMARSCRGSAGSTE